MNNKSSNKPAIGLREALRQFARLLVDLRPYWGAFVKAIFVGFSVSCLGLIAPLLSKILFDRVYPTADVPLLHIVVAGILAATITGAALSSLKAYYSAAIGTRIVLKVSQRLFSHVLHLPVRFFDEHRIGEILSRFADVRLSLDSVSKILDTVLISGPFALLIPPILVAINFRLALVALIAVPATSVVSTLSGRLVRRALTDGAKASADLSAYQFEILSHIRSVKTSTAEGQVYSNAYRQLEAALRFQLRSASLIATTRMVNVALQALVQAGISLFAWTLILTRELSLGDYIAFVAYMTALAGPVGQFTDLFLSFQQSAVSLGRMFEYMDLETEQPIDVSRQRHRVGTVALRGDIVFSQVHFEYAAGTPVLNDFDLRIKEGVLTAIVGASGAGKSSVLRLLGRLESPDSGAISIGNTNLDSMQLYDLRRQLSVVWQEFSVMQGTIWDNLTVGLQDVSLARVDAAIRACQLDDLIDRLPEGYQTNVGEWGATLSGGQRQRIMLARAIIRETPIVLLDEVTSNLDLATERALLNDVRRILLGRTVVVVTHRPSAAVIADTVVMLDAGKVAATGRHGDLMLENRYYRRLLDATDEMSMTSSIR